MECQSHFYFVRRIKPICLVGYVLSAPKKFNEEMNSGFVFACQCYAGF